MNFIRHILLALQFFTRIPVTGRLAAWVGYSPELLRASAAHFPAIGWLVGAVAASAYAVLGLLLPDSAFTPLLAAVLSTVLTVLLTGGLHEDGLSDVADGLGGGHTRERALEIMKDSRVGAFGVLALVLALLAKVALLAVLGDIDWGLACASLFGAHVVSRFFPLGLIRLLPYVSEAVRAKSAALAGQIDAASLVVAALWLVAALVLLQVAYPDIVWVSGLFGAFLAWLLMWAWLARRLQGYTGDCLGATQQVCELAFYLGLALSL